MIKKVILKGIGASSGIVVGNVRIIKNEKDFLKFKKGEILVTEITDPTMIMVIRKTKAIITDIGGLTSHPAIISRELGIPCVVGTEKATKVLKNGMRIKINGEKGTIYEI